MADPLNHFSEGRSDPVEAVDGSAGDPRAAAFSESQIKGSGQILLDQIKDFVRTRGLRYLVIGGVANVMSMVATNLLYCGLKPRVGVALASLSCALVHGLIIYSSHHFFTFESRQNFLKGFSKSLTANVPLLIVFNAVTIYVLSKEWMSLWMLQIILTCLGQAYGIAVNLFWVFRTPRSKGEGRAMN